MKNLKLVPLLSLTLGIAFAATTQTQAGVVADFVEDFDVEEIPQGWSYKWNQTGVSLGEHSEYIDMVPFKAEWEANNRYQVDSEHPPSKNNPVPNAMWLRIAKGEIASGQPIAQSTDGRDHYGILMYTIQPGEAGFGSIVNSKIQNKRAEPGRDAQFSIFVNETKLGSDIVKGTSESRFDIPLGPLRVGDTVYVAIGPGEARNGAVKIEFQIDTEL
ncbi:MAG: hypothetical protein ACSHYA_09175 [Opitutaceae bacterium]